MMFFFREKSKVSFPVVRGIWWVFRYHLGTVAFGSCIIAIIQLIRTILAYIQNKLVLIYFKLLYYNKYYLRECEANNVINSLNYDRFDVSSRC